MKKTLIAASLFALAGAANAASYGYSFSDVQQGVSGTSIGTSVSVASLTVADGGSGLLGYAHSVTFSLTNTFDLSLGSPSNAKVANFSFSSGALYGLMIYGASPDFQFKVAGADFVGPEYKVVFNTGSASFGNNETASWTVYGGAGLDAGDFNSFLLQVNATGGFRSAASGVLNTDTAGIASIHFAPAAPVPEPETYAMLLAGLGLMATIARRRRTRND